MPKATILIVEDDAILAMNLQRMLALQGHNVAGPLASGEAALAFLEDETVDLVLMDIELAGHMNGIEAAEIINKRFDTPIVFLTGFSQDPLLAEAKVAAPYGYLIKPVPERELAATLEMALYRHSLDRQLRESQRALAKSEAQYRQLFANSPLGIFRTTLDGQVLAINAEMARILGCAPPGDEGCDLTALDSQFAADPDRHRQFLAQLRQERAVQHFEMEIRQGKGSGNTLWVSLNARISPLDPASGGQDQEVIDGFAIDITERRRIEHLQAFLAQTSTGPADRPFFHKLAEFLAHSLGMEFVCIDVLEGDGLTARTVAVWCDDHFEDNVSYSLKDTPCGEVVEQTVCCYPASVCQFFPKDQVLQDLKAESYVGATLFDQSGRPIGLIAVIGRTPLVNRPLAEATLQMVAGRAAGEMERQQAEEALRQSEDKHRTLVASIPDVVMRFDRQGRHLFASENISELVAYTADQCIGKTHRDLGFAEDLCRSWSAALQGVFASGLPCEGESSFTGRKGWVTHNWRLIPERDSQGQVQSVLNLSRDITAHRLAERQYQALFREMLDGFALHEIICDSEGQPTDYRFLAVNPTFERMTGLKAADLIGRTVLEVMPNTEPLWIATYGQVALTGKPFHFENYSRELDKHFEVSAFQPLPNQFACIFIDISDRKRIDEERKQLQAQLLQAQKMEAIGTLAGGIAHDFNNILGAILGYTEIAGDSLPPGSLAGGYLEKVMEAGQRAASLVRQILAFSRQADTENISLHPAAIVKEAIKILRPSLPSTITINQRIDPAVKPILADPTQVHQCLLNLCTNAFHAMEETGGVLDIALENRVLSREELLDQPGVQPGSFTVLAITDSGTGIPMAIQDKIFDPYFTTKEIGKGTGLGLAIVHGVIKKAGGFITCRSEPGKGTCFQAFFPAIDQALAAGEATATAIATGKERILFVDDEELLVDLATTMLRRLGYEVEGRTSSLEAWATFQDQPDRFDAVITDQTMPGLTGLDLALKMLRLRPELPIILCTGYSSLISEEKVRALGIQGFALKPLVKKEIAALLRTILDAGRRAQH